jgi:hemerythrin-like domain-containing protein
LVYDVGNLISAFAFASYTTYKEAKSGDVNYLFIARLWFAVGVVLGVVFFVVSLQKAMLDHHSDQRLRSLLWVWMAAFAMAGPTYLAVTEEEEQEAVSRSVLYQSLFLFALFLFAVNAIGFLRGFYSYVADMSIWNVPFACAVLSLSAAQYYTLTDGEFSMLLAIFIISTTCTSASVCFGYTLMWSFDKSLFRPRVKWGPVSFMKLTHEMFRFAFPKLLLQLDSLHDSRSELNVVAVKLFVKELEAFFLAYAEHGEHEEKVLFPVLRRFHPNLNPSMDEEHEYEHNLLATMQTAVNTFNDGEQNPAAMVQLLQELKGTFPEFSSHVLEHLRNEERTITVVARKYLTVAQQKEVNNRVWELTPVENWYITMPYIIKNLPHPQWRVRFVRTFIWAKPDRAQEIGLICYRTLNSVDWEFLAQEIPEIIPRGVRGWVRQY